MREDELFPIVKGTPLRVIETGETMYFRSARHSPHTDCAMVILVDDAQNHTAFRLDEIERIGEEE